MAENNQDDSMPTRASNMEPAEGSRDTVENSGNRGGGITNRGLDREMDEQQHLPERGKSQDESSATDQASGDMPDTPEAER